MSSDDPYIIFYKTKTIKTKRKGGKLGKGNKTKNKHVWMDRDVEPSGCDALLGVYNGNPYVDLLTDTKGCNMGREGSHEKCAKK